MTAIKFVLIIASFLARTVANQSWQAGLYRDQQRIKIGYGNFKPDLNHRVSKANITSILVDNTLDCPFKCINEAKCKSFNLAANPDSDGLYLCELLDTDKYRAAANDLQRNSAFHHFSPWSKCYSSSCLNNGKCIPNIQQDSCVCKPGFTGTHCEDCKFDFEDGIDGWLKTGAAFDNQPTFGDNPTARSREPAHQQGDWWIGGYEDRPSKEAPAGTTKGDGPQGTLTLPSFKITGGQITFLIGGGCDVNIARAELIIANQSVRNVTGSCLETMTRKTWDVQEFIGQRASVKLVDFSSDGWGHINFDDLKGDISCAD